jgi:hypothetical protein
MTVTPRQPQRWEGNLIPIPPTDVKSVERQFRDPTVSELQHTATSSLKGEAAEAGCTALAETAPDLPCRSAQECL